MTVADFPKIPDELNQRISELLRKLEEDEINHDDVIRKAVNSLGKTRIDHTGIKTLGHFGEIIFDSDDLRAMIESGKYGLELIYIIKGKEFYIKVGNEIEKILFGFPFKTMVDDIPETDLENAPIVEFKPDKDGKYPENRMKIVLDFLNKQYIDMVPVRDPGFVVHNFEAFAGFFKDWKEFSYMLEALVALLEMTTKKKMIQTGESAFLLMGDILKECGV